MIRTDYTGDQHFKDAMYGIYRARRHLGDSVDDAYLYVL